MKTPKTIFVRYGYQKWLVTAGKRGYFGNFSGQEIIPVTAENITRVNSLIEEAAKDDALLNVSCDFSMPFNPVPSELVTAFVENAVDKALTGHPEFSKGK